MANLHPNPMQPPNRGSGEFHFLKLMAEEVGKGYSPGSTFNRKHQLYVYGKFRSMFGPLYSDRYLRAKLKNLQKRYLDFSELLNQEGITWNRKTNIVKGNEELLKERWRVNMHIFNLTISAIIFHSNMRNNRFYEMYNSDHLIKS